MNAPQRFVARNSRVGAGLMFAFALGFVALGLWFIGAIGVPPKTEDDAVYWLGWGCIVIFGAAAFIWSKRLFDSEPMIVVDANGILARTWSDTPIPWAAISDCSIFTFRRARQLGLHLVEPARYPSTTAARFVAPANRAMAGGDIYLDTAGTDRKFTDLLAAVEAWRHWGR